MLDCASLGAVTATREAGAVDEGPPSGRAWLRGPHINLSRVPLLFRRASAAPGWRRGGGKRPAPGHYSPAKVERTPAPVTSEATGSNYLTGVLQLTAAAAACARHEAVVDQRRRYRRRTPRLTALPPLSQNLQMPRPAGAARLTLRLLMVLLLAAGISAQEGAAPSPDGERASERRAGRLPLVGPDSAFASLSHHTHPIDALPLPVPAEAAARAVREAIDNWQEFAAGKGLQGWDASLPLCQWGGVICSGGGQVQTL